MVNKLTKFLSTTFGRIVFLFISMSIFCLVILTLERFADTREVWSFDCQSDVYRFETTSAEPKEIDEGELFLSLTVEDGQIRLDYYNADKPSDREFISLAGELKELEVGSVSYQLDLAVTDVQFENDNSYLKTYLAKELDEPQANLSIGSQVNVTVKVLEMSMNKNYISIKFTPNSSSWICRLHE
ncbi:hypothetical protein AN944_02758 [Shewanella sp. P1-14-1]|uniref:hypothetical protein n=1 Tax=Shewanella sp. P1-14-1 TaxID=1723761 RepID=UPI0006D66C7F|nr:hypothetical protein [Shewanella sp. P1-14-1]KPZ69777.1 hypothetical protein AN944_02758 [Shewanella sp. P1-14-1]